ncbi:MAG: OmpA family protein [Prevotellaceae bacterium]|jgi:outer membrane protein OmpA-like peptidoglycan-associated protein/Tol biopolymer transport system component|nr:OmpA family protein [Prevotellaceae bacterium]
MKKNLLLIGCLIVLGLSAQSQLSTSNTKAVKAYKKALTQYANRADIVKRVKKVIKIDPKFVEPYWVVAELSGYKDAIEILQLAIKNKTRMTDQTRMMLAGLYYKAGEYSNAIGEIQLIDDNNPQKQGLLNDYQKIIGLFRDTVPFEPKNLIYANTNYDEYFPSVTADDKILSVTTSLKYGTYGEQEDMAYSRQVNGNWMPFLPIDELNTANNEGSQTISADGRYMFFVGCNRPDGLGSCDIYYSINTNGSWGYPINPRSPLNSSEWETNPSLSPAGNELFFATNRKGLNSGSDIWHCDVEIMENGLLKFSNPRPLSNLINTAKTEYAPFIHSDNQTLYFLSDGHPGFGGADIFVSRKDENGVWGIPKNLGYPINTKDNVYGFTVNGAGNKGYISLKNTENPQRGLDIYEFELYPEIRPRTMTYIVGNVYDADTQKPLGATVETFDYNSQKTIAESVSDIQIGEFTTFLPDTGQYGLNIRKSGYLFYSSKLEKSKEKLKVYLQPIKSGKSIVLNNIFFDFNSSDLDPKSEKEISRLTDFLNKNSNVKVMIVGHTDNVGSYVFNKNLSEKRAEAVVNALIDRGILKDRLSSKGMGATQSVAPNDTEEGRAKNRRVESEIL